MHGLPWQASKEIIISADTPLRASVIVPVRNRPELLRRVLETLAAQDFDASAYEVIVCDDGSTDDIGTVVSIFENRGLEIRLERQAPNGPAAARNRGIRVARAAIVVFVDSDVELEPEFVRLLVEALEREPKWIGTEACLLPAGGREGLLWDAPGSDAGGRYHTAAIAYRRNTLVAIGGFDETFKLPACEDVELAIRALQHGQIAFVRNAVARHPRRRVTALTHWKWRRHWRYETFLAVRYGILSFPGQSSGPYPRLRVLWAAIVTLPAGRFLKALGSLKQSPRDATLAAAYAVFDIACGAVAAPTILFTPVPTRRDYVSGFAAVETLGDN